MRIKPPTASQIRLGLFQVSPFEMDMGSSGEDPWIGWSEGLLILSECAMGHALQNQGVRIARMALQSNSERPKPTPCLVQRLIHDTAERERFWQIRSQQQDPIGILDGLLVGFLGQVNQTAMPIGEERTNIKRNRLVQAYQCFTPFPKSGGSDALQQVTIHIGGTARVPSASAWRG